MAPHRSFGIRPRLVVLGVAVAMAAPALLVAPTHAADDPVSTSPAAAAPEQPSRSQVDADAFRELASQVARNERLVTELAAQIDGVNARLTELAAEIAETQRQLDATRAEVARLTQIVRSRAAFIYTHAHAPTALVDIERVEDIASGRKYTESATRTDTGKINELESLANALDERRRGLEAARAEQEAERDRLQAAKEELEALLAKQKRMLDAAGAITVIGDPELTAEQMATWFESRGVRYRLAGGTSIHELAQLYVEEGAAERVRPEMAFVQAILETGSFGNATDNNYAGIGACDSCTGQIPFATPREGVRGQIQMLRNYADPDSRAANLANPPSAPIYGSDPVRAANAYDTFFAKGRVPTWNLMGNGNWATDPGYAPKVLTLYFQLVGFATRRP